MEEYYYGRGHVPAFGSWDWNNDLPFTQCFESARQAGGFLRYSYSEDRDLYVAGDLYQNDVVTPAVIVVPCHPRQGKVRQSRTKQGKTMKKQQQQGEEDMGYNFNDCQDVVGKEPPSPPPNFSTTSSVVPRRGNAKPVDEDLYKISPELLYASSKPKKKRGLGLFSSCLLPTCVV